MKTKPDLTSEFARAYYQARLDDKTPPKPGATMELHMRARGHTKGVQEMDTVIEKCLDNHPDDRNWRIRKGPIKK